MFLLFGCLGLAQSSSKPIEQIQEELQNHDFARALALAQVGLHKAPNDPRLLTLQGNAYVGQGDKKAALASFRHALKFAPDAIPALHGAAQIEYEAGSAAAIPLFQHLLQLQPQDTTTHGMLAVVAYQQGNCKLAVPHFEKAEVLFDSQVEGLHAYATCLMRLKDFDHASTVLQRALALSPNDARERKVLAATQLRTAHSQEALTTLEPLLQVNPDAEALELASTAHENGHDTPQAVSLLRQAILLDPQNVNLYVDFALISAAHQSNDVGINIVSEGIAQQPNAAALYLARGILYAQLDKYDKAQADFEKANELDPTQSMSVAAQSLTAMQKNDLDVALKSVQGKLVRNPNDAALLYLQGDILAQKGFAPDTPEFATALRSAKKAVALQPALGPAHGVLAKLYLRNENYKAAAEECRVALKIDPTDQTALYRLIQSLQKSGDKTETTGLVKRLADLRHQSAKEESERNRYRLADDGQP
ncbi:MAG TPA: tetratricopeptide repeat protein [Terriglobales bacterium]|nr:tetratricopeptide repeat protein [Terriglobales bacterium]